MQRNQSIDGSVIVSRLRGDVVDNHIVRHLGIDQFDDGIIVGYLLGKG
jgi:hypothetical protein